MILDKLESLPGDDRFMSGKTFVLLGKTLKRLADVLPNNRVTQGFGSFVLLAAAVVRDKFKSGTIRAEDTADNTELLVADFRRVIRTYNMCELDDRTLGEAFAHLANVVLHTEGRESEVTKDVAFYADLFLG